MTRAPSDSAISAVWSLLESTIRISASGTMRRMSEITLLTAFSSFIVIMATVRLCLLSGFAMGALFRVL